MVHLAMLAVVITVVYVYLSIYLDKNIKKNCVR